MTKSTKANKQPAKRVNARRNLQKNEKEQTLVS